MTSPIASLRAIENDRAAMGHRNSRCARFSRDGQPRIDVMQAPGGGWVATAICSIGVGSTSRARWRDDLGRRVAGHVENRTVGRKGFKNCR